jgi:energy-coupling factor transport system ATP-binding protein
MRKNQFELENVSVAYITNEGIHPVIIDLNLTIAAGDFVAVIGENGSGKSTLALVLAGLCSISRGKLIMNTSAPSSVQIVFQNPDAQIIGETIYEDICFGLENRCVNPAEMPSRVEQALAMVGLEHLMHHPVELLSGGQKQLLCIASALAMDAEVIIMDEPTAMLDPYSKGIILETVDRIHKQGRTIIWITQLMDEVGHANRVVVMNQGRIIYEGSPVDFFYNSIDENSMYESPCLTLGFTPPYSVKVASSLINAGMIMDKPPVLMRDLKKVVAELCQ